MTTYFILHCGGNNRKGGETQLSYVQQVIARRFFKTLPLKHHLVISSQYLLFLQISSQQLQFDNRFTYISCLKQLI